MAITRPVSRTTISTTDWGIPVTDELNRLTTWQLAQVPTPWVNVTFQNGWTVWTGNTSYRKIGDMVYIRGTAASGAVGTTIFTLPTTFRPPAQLQFLQTSWATAFANIGVNPDGTVTFMSGDTRYTALNIAFSITP